MLIVIISIIYYTYVLVFVFTNHNKKYSPPGHKTRDEYNVITAVIRLIMKSNGMVLYCKDLFITYGGRAYEYGRSNRRFIIIIIRTKR